MSCERDLYRSVIASLASGEAEDFLRTVGQHGGARGEVVQSDPAVTHPHRPGWHTIGDMRMATHLAAVVVDADRRAINQAAGGCVSLREPELRRGVQARERRQRPALVVEGVELRERSPLPEGERIRRL